MPCHEKNKKYIAHSGNFKKLVKPKVFYEARLIKPKGIPPCARYMHSTAYFKSGDKSGYLAIFGGRNDELFQ